MRSAILVAFSILHSALLYTAFPVFRAIRCLEPFSRIVYPTRVGFPEAGSISWTLPTGSGAGALTFVPGWPAFLLRSKRVWMLTFSTTTFAVLLSTETILPVFPLSLPDKTLTVSPFLIFIFIDIALKDHYVLRVCTLGYKTSGAKETIFANPFSRSSRATGPKIRVPRGSTLSLFTKTTAFSSNRM